MPVDLYDPDSYVAAPPHDVLAELRRTLPVYFQDMEGEPGYWAVLKHADVVHVAREPKLFSASEGGVMLENLAPAQLDMMRNMLLAMDPPRHVDYRRPIEPRFRARVIAEMEEQIRAICRDIMAEAAEKGDVEFVHDVTSALPSRVIGQLMGLPPDDLPFIHRLAEMNTSSQDSDYTSDVSQGTIDMAMYAIQFAATRREEEPREDLTTLLLETDFNGSYMTDIDFGSFFVQLVTAGNDTTKTMLSSGLRCLLDHPDQLADLRADPTLVGGAVEEILRYENPLHYFRRTATADTELRGTPIAAGDKVVMFYTSANRDEDVFDDPQRFDIRRNPNPHLSFGIAEHFCLGVHLARLEGRVFFEELLQTFPTIELTGEPVRIRSNLNNALKALPIHLAR
jgi:cytochrome P450